MEICKMADKAHSHFLIIVALLGCLFLSGCRKGTPGEGANAAMSVVTSDSILSTMGAALLPAGAFEIASILPPGQCPGHYDVKLSDIARVKRATLVVSFAGMPFMGNVEMNPAGSLLINSEGRNWMTPDSYIAGLNLLARKLSERFPEYERKITGGREHAILEVNAINKRLSERLRQGGVVQRPAITSSMLKEPLEWMGFRVVGEYGRPESISAKEISALIRIGREKKAAIVVDNLQSGPEAGAGIAEALGVPHVVLSNFPSEKGYAATLADNVDVVLAALGAK
jgi:zinc transport system substrate-binding protein